MRLRLRIQQSQGGLFGVRANPRDGWYLQASVRYALNPVDVLGLCSTAPAPHKPACREGDGAKRAQGGNSEL